MLTMQGCSAHPVLTRRAAGGGQLDRLNMFSSGVASFAGPFCRLLPPSSSRGVFTRRPAKRASSGVRHVSACIHDTFKDRNHHCFEGPALPHCRQRLLYPAIIYPLVSRHVVGGM